MMPLQEPIPPGVLRVGPSAGKGLGVFAMRDIAKGSVVCTMRHPCRIHQGAWSVVQRQRHYPHDGCLSIPRSADCIYDESFPRGPLTHKQDLEAFLAASAEVPIWYRLNHSACPNLLMQVVNDHRPQCEQTVAWMARWPIHAGDELTFKYEGSTAAWDAAERRTRQTERLLSCPAATPSGEPLPPVNITLSCRYRWRVCTGWGHGRRSDHESGSEYSCRLASPGAPSSPNYNSSSQGGSDHPAGWPPHSEHHV